jgi:hypothetical protein
VGFAVGSGALGATGVAPGWGGAGLSTVVVVGISGAAVVVGGAVSVGTVGVGVGSVAAEVGAGASDIVQETVR